MLDKLIDLILEFLHLFIFWHVIDPYEQGLILRLGKFRKLIDCGFHWIAPFGIDKVLAEHIVPTTHALGDASITTADGKSVGFHAVVTYKVRDLVKAILEVESSDHAVRDACAG